MSTVWNTVFSAKVKPAFLVTLAVDQDLPQDIAGNLTPLPLGQVHHQD